MFCFEKQRFKSLTDLLVLSQLFPVVQAPDIFHEGFVEGRRLLRRVVAEVGLAVVVVRLVVGRKLGRVKLERTGHFNPELP